MNEVGIETKIVEFCRFARSSGIASGPRESADAIAVVEVTGIQDRQLFKMGLRAVLCSSKEDWDVFEDVFQAFWATSESDRRTAARALTKPQTAGDRTSLQGAAALLGAAVNAGPAVDEGKLVLGAAAHEKLKRKDFSEISQSDLPLLEQVALQLLRRMSLRVSRKLKACRPFGLVDLRRTIRRSISAGGDPMELSFKGKQLEANRLVILLDISGSMNSYSLFLLRFAYVLQKYFKHVHTFLFSTRLAEITSFLRKRKLGEALHALSQQETGWSGGTRIGESLREFNFLYGRKVLSRNTMLLVLSDGWDTGEPEVLARQLSAIKLRVRKLIWLNPLLGMEGYEPVTRGMAAALPYIDVFAPAHNLESLLALEAYLGRN